MPDSAKKFRSDVAWNIGSLAIAGGSGIVLNVLIGLVYDAAALGVFNQVFAAYILGSQVAALGVHHSVLQQVAAAEERSGRAAATTSGLAVAIALGVAVAGMFALAAPLIGSLVSSPDVGTGVLYVVPALLFFAVDKITLGAINGARRMRWYALLQGARVGLMLPAFAICALLEVDRSVLPVIITAAEGVTLVLSLVCIRDLLTRLPSADLLRRAKDHLAFGAKGFMSGVLAELNTRVDVLMLGYFSTDTVVGIYSFAAIIAEGLFQLLVVFRTNYAPLCARLLATDEHEELSGLIRRGRNRTYLASIAVAAAAVAAYTFVLPLIIHSPIATESASYFAVLIAGMALVSGYIPFSQLLLHARFPGWHTYLMLATAAVNLIANVILIKTIGPIGAAVGTSIAFVSMIVLLNVLVRRLTGLKI